MKHIKVIEIIDEAHGTVVLNIFYISAQIESRSLMEFLIELEEEDFINLFPEIKEVDYYQVDKLSEEDIHEFLVDANKLGFIAITNHPIHTNFTFKPDGEFKSCSYSRVTYQSYVYAETISELMKKIAKKAEYWYNIDLQRARARVIEVSKNIIDTNKQ